MRILLSGYLGHMGKEVITLANASTDLTIAAGVDFMAEGEYPVPVYKTFEEVETDVDCIIDFSHHCVTGALLDFAVSKNIPLVLATTGHTHEEKELIEAASTRIPLFFAANYSLGVALLIELAKKNGLRYGRC